MESLVKTITVCFQKPSPNISWNMLSMPIRLSSKRRLINLIGQLVLQTFLSTMIASRQCIAEELMASLVKTITVCFQNASPNFSSNILKCLSAFYPNKIT